MKITKKYIMEHRTDRGAWTQPQLDALGVSWPPAKGWMDLVIGQEISDYRRQIFESKITIKQQRKLRRM